MERTVVILLSDKRSGSTMFQRELSKHVAVQTVDYSSHTYLETHHWLKGAVILGLPKEKFSGRNIYKGYGSIDNARTYMIDTIQGNCKDFSLPSNDRDLVFNGWEALCEKFAQPVFFEKSPQLLANWAGLELMLEWIRNTSFKVKIIGLVRNPLSVQYSAFKLFHTLPHKRQFGWLEIQENLLKIKNILDEDTFMLTRYEDIIAEPVKEFTKITDFIGLVPNEMVGSSAHGESLLKWKTDPFFQFELAPEVRSIAVQLGYKADELNMPQKPNPPFIQRLQYKLKSTTNKLWSKLWNRRIRPILLKFKN